MKNTGSILFILFLFFIISDTILAQRVHHGRVSYYAFTATFTDSSNKESLDSVKVTLIKRSRRGQIKKIAIVYADKNLLVDGKNYTDILKIEKEGYIQSTLTDSDWSFKQGFNNVTVNYTMSRITRGVKLIKKE